MKKRNIIALLMLLVLCISLIGCSSQKQDGNKKTSVPEEASIGSDEEEIQKVVDAYSEALYNDDMTALWDIIYTEETRESMEIACKAYAHKYSNIEVSIDNLLRKRMQENEFYEYIVAEDAGTKRNVIRIEDIEDESQLHDAINEYFLEYLGVTVDYSEAKLVLLSKSNNYNAEQIDAMVNGQFDEIVNEEFDGTLCQEIAYKADGKWHMIPSWFAYICKASASRASQTAKTIKTCVEVSLADKSVYYMMQPYFNTIISFNDFESLPRQFQNEFCDCLRTKDIPSPIHKNRVNNISYGFMISQSGEYIECTVYILITDGNETQEINMNDNGYTQFLLYIYLSNVYAKEIEVMEKPEAPVDEVTIKIEDEVLPAYQEYINSCADIKQLDDCVLIYVNDDDIPELFCCFSNYEGIGYGYELLAYCQNTREITSIDANIFCSFAYVERSGIVQITEGNGGIGPGTLKPKTYYQLTDDCSTFEEVSHASAQYSEKILDNYDASSAESWEECEIDGQPVDAQTFIDYDKKYGELISPYQYVSAPYNCIWEAYTNLGMTTKKPTTEADWAKAYYNYLLDEQQNGLDRINGAFIIYVDDNDIPELFIVWERGAVYYNQILSYQDGNILMSGGDSPYCISYIEKENLFYESGGRGGLGGIWSYLRKIENGEFIEIGHTGWSAETDITSFYWDGQEVSEEEYNKLLYENFDSKTTIYVGCDCEVQISDIYSWLQGQYEE